MTLFGRLFDARAAVTRSRVLGTIRRCRADVYTGRVACCPLVSHGEYANGTYIQKDGRTPDRYVTLSAKRASVINHYRNRVAILVTYNHAVIVNFCRSVIVSEFKVDHGRKVPAKSRFFSGALLNSKLMVNRITKKSQHSQQCNDS